MDTHRYYSISWTAYFNHIFYSIWRLWRKWIWVSANWLVYLCYMITRILYRVSILLSIPLIAMTFTDEVSWSFFDFIIMGTMLTIAGSLIEITLNKFKTSKYRIVFTGIIVIIFLLIWAELGVGIFGTRFAGD